MLNPFWNRIHDEYSPGLDRCSVEYLAHKKQRPPRTLQWDYAKGPMLALSANRCSLVWLVRESLLSAVERVIKSGRGAARAEDAQGTPTQSHISSSILVYEENIRQGQDLVRAFTSKSLKRFKLSPLRSEAVECLVHESLRGSEEGSYLRLIDFCITQLQARE